MKRYVTSEQIEKIYWLRKAGYSFEETAEKLGIGRNSAVSVMRSIGKYFDDKVIKGRRVYSYVEAVRNIRGKSDSSLTVGPVKEEVVEEIKILGGDRFERLNSAFEVLKEEIGHFIESEVARQVGDVLKENEDLRGEISDIKKRY